MRGARRACIHVYSAEHMAEAVLLARAPRSHASGTEIYGHRLNYSAQSSKVRQTERADGMYVCVCE